jgi:hypothetical protein
MIMPMTQDQVLAKMASKGGNASNNVKTAPAGQPSVAPAPGPSSNVKTAPAGPSTNKANPTGSPTQNTSPESGARGASNTGPIRHTKEAGFASGILKAARADLQEAQADAFDEALLAQGIQPEVIDALAVLEDNKVIVDMPADFQAKVAEAKKAAGLDDEPAVETK